MRLKEDINFLELINQVKLCEDDIFFVSQKGDKLNLKSEFSKLIFVSILEDKELLKNSRIECKNEKDYQILRKYFSDAD